MFSILIFFNLDNPSAKPIAPSLPISLSLKREKNIENILNM